MTLNPYLPSNVDSRPAKDSARCFYSLVVSGALGVLGSFALLSWSGGAEPFYGPENAMDRFISLWVGGSALVAWGLWSVFVVVASVRRTIPRLAILLCLLSMLGAFFAAITVFSYLEDRETYEALISSRHK